MVKSSQEGVREYKKLEFEDGLIYVNIVDPQLVQLENDDKSAVKNQLDLRWVS